MKTLHFTELNEISGGDCVARATLCLIIPDVMMPQFIHACNQRITGQISEADYFIFVSSLVAPLGGPDSLYLSSINFPLDNVKGC